MTSTSPRPNPVPSSAIPLAYFVLAYAALAAGLVMLIAVPALPGGFFYHPKMVALTHVLTLGWLTGSILGAFYIVAPLSLACPMPVRRRDWIAFGSYAIGLAGMVTHFWMAEYSGMVWSAAMVTGAIGLVAVRAWRGLARTPWPIALHVRLAFVNVLVAAAGGMIIGLDRTAGFLTMSPLAATYAHAHLAAVGWVGLMVVGLSYRLVPMLLPCAMPSGRALAWSAVLIESGLIFIVVALLGGSSWLPVGAVIVGAGFASAAVQLGRAARTRRPRPPGLPARDWSVWQIRGAAIWLGVAMILALLLASGAVPGHLYARVAWVYGVAGLVGWLAQMVAGVEGRLLPLYAWYRELARRGAATPTRSVHELVSAPHARVVFLAWTTAVPVLAAGLAAGQAPLVRAAAGLLLIGVVAGAVHASVILRRVR